MLSWLIFFSPWKKEVFFHCTDLCLLSIYFFTNEHCLLTFFFVIWLCFGWSPKVDMKRITFELKHSLKCMKRTHFTFHCSQTFSGNFFFVCFLFGVYTVHTLGVIWFSQQIAKEHKHIEKIYICPIHKHMHAKSAGCVKFLQTNTY